VGLASGSSSGNSCDGCAQKRDKSQNIKECSGRITRSIAELGVAVVHGRAVFGDLPKAPEFDAAIFLPHDSPVVGILRCHGTGGARQTEEAGTPGSGEGPPGNEKGCPAAAPFRRLEPFSGVGVGGDGAGFVVLHVEDGVELGDLEQVVDFAGQVEQLQLAALVADSGVGAHQLADARAVDLIHFA
jgi:hypothetical protein